MRVEFNKEGEAYQYLKVPQEVNSTRYFQLSGYKKI